MNHTSLSKAAGIWIDHRKAVICTLTLEGESLQTIESNVEKHPGAAGTHSKGGYEADHVSPDDVRDRKFTGHLQPYYDEVIQHIRDAEEILVFGPGEAKGEFKKHLEHHKLGERTLLMEAADTMTDPQIAEHTREHFGSRIRV